MKAHSCLAMSLWLLATMFTCDGGSAAVSDLTRRTSPFDQLQNVCLGMTSGDLSRARPLARPAPYLGYDERVGDYRIDYEFPGSYSEEQVVPKRSRLREVTAVREFSSTREVAAAWQEKVQDMARRLGGAPECFNVVRGGRHGALAVWNQGEVTVRTEFLESYVSRSVGREIRNPALLLVQIESPGRLAKWWKQTKSENTTGVSITPPCGLLPRRDRCNVRCTNG